MTEQRTTTRAGKVWALVPAALLGSMLLGLGSLAYIAMDDPGFALEPNYYDKAVHWDRARAEQRDGLALGLVLRLAKPLVVAADGTIEVELSIVDKQGAALTGADVQLEAFPNAFASRVERQALREVSPGAYAVRLKRGVSGLWELRCSVRHAGTHFRQVLRADALKVGAA